LVKSGFSGGGEKPYETIEAHARRELDFAQAFAV
jgi:hypothetical protein